jgi:hypothetical protein
MYGGMPAEILTTPGLEVGFLLHIIHMLTSGKIYKFQHFSSYTGHRSNI